MHTENNFTFKDMKKRESVWFDLAFRTKTYLITNLAEMFSATNNIHTLSHPLIHRYAQPLNFD